VALFWTSHAHSVIWVGRLAAEAAAAPSGHRRRAADPVNLAEEPTGEPAPAAKGRTLRLEARPHGIVTVRVELG